MSVYTEDWISIGGTQYYRCFTCSSCDIECPINQRTGKLFPRYLVRLAVFGYKDELIHERSIWYCIECDRCSRACPMDVKPSRVIKNAREEAINKGVVSGELVKKLIDLKKHLQKVRLLVANEVFSSGTTPDVERLWTGATENLPDFSYKHDLKIENRQTAIRKFSSYLDSSTSLTSCWACGACTNACPVATSSHLFSPMKIVRQVNWGFYLDPLYSGRAWLCINCERCLDTCPQAVKGAWIIKAIQNNELEAHPTLKGKYIKWKTADSTAHRMYINSIDSLLSDAGL